MHVTNHMLDAETANSESHLTVGQSNLPPFMGIYLSGDAQTGPLCCSFLVFSFVVVVV